MTAEIALLNKLAITLAADSAVTISSPQGPKVYNSADKIFEGTVHDPIGIMVFNNPEISGIPIEVVIKMYRDHNCHGHFKTVFEYSDAFLGYVEELDAPDIVIASTIHSLVWRRAIGVRSSLRTVSEEFFRSATNEKYPSVDALVDAIGNHISEVLDDDIASLEVAPVSDWANGLSIEEVLYAHQAVIGELLDIVFDEEPLAPQHRERVIRLLGWSLLKENQREVLTGLVFAGFGQEEKFPSLIAFEVYGIVAGRLKYMQTTKFDVDRKLSPDAAVYPFAQKDMVDRFMYGLDGEFLELCNAFFGGALTSMKEQLGELLVDAEPAVQAAVAPATDAILQEFNGTVVPDHVQRLTTQFSDMVRSMPKQEMAALAESLVHITSLKRKFSAGAESVGGPIDVAMITRAEGFVWVKRKHYFDAALNPRYFHRRYGGNNGTRNGAEIKTQ